jgi:hypothetical protein
LVALVVGQAVQEVHPSLALVALEVQPVLPFLPLEVQEVHPSLALVALEVQVVLPFLASVALVVGQAVQGVHPSLALVALVERLGRPSSEVQVVLPFRA